jgi:hypothetical protein
MCWLCTYQGEALGKKLNHFIVRHIGVIDIKCISVQVSDFLLLQEPNAEGASQAVVYEHISKHMLHPRVRIAVMLRQLLDFSNILQSTLIAQDNGLCTVEKSNTELYLKVIGQIMQLYRADTQGMLFADDDKMDQVKRDES